jgi:aspartyl-tRNA(Asn)/glutamyl-tRNA(Gln) amidotransferase subunit B
MEFEAVIGLEVHAQLLTRSKIFCACSTRFGDSANANTCPVCLGLPGALPVLNREAVGMAIKAALALGCRINRRSIFARKNYFYPDLPKGYQISQYDQPLAEHGQAILLSGERTEKGNIVNRVNKSFGIHRVHLEEDAGKSIHGTSFRDAHTLINLNRSGVPLIEIVSEPDFRTSQEAYDYLTHLRKTLLYLGVCDGNMEEGSLRCDANVSVRPVGQERFGTKIEIKNLNSFRFLQKALDYEIRRQVDALRRGEVIYQETRLWDEEAGMTSVMRTKEEAHDYRYFPEPDLLPLFIDDVWLATLEQSMPELPEARRQRFETQYGLAIDESLLLVSQPETADYYEQVIGSGCSPRLAANWILGELFYELKNSGKEIRECPVAPVSLGDLILLIERNEISSKMAKTVFCEMFATGEMPSIVLGRLGLTQISDTSALEGIIAEVLAENPRQLAEFRGGKEKLFGFFVGQVMKKSFGQANPQRLNELLKKSLAG